MSEEAEVVTKSPGSLLADEMYGAPTPAETEVHVEAPVEDLPVVEDPPAGDEQLVVEDPQTPGDNEVEVHTIEELAEHFELEPGWIENLTIKQKVNGKQIDVPLTEALTTHRKVKAADTYLSDAKEKSKSIMAGVNQQAEQMNYAVVTAGTMLKTLGDELEADTNAIDWAALRTQDPAEYSAKKDEHRDRAARIAKLQQDAVAQYQTVSQQFAQQNEEAMQASLPQQHEILVERIPEWTDDEKAGKERSELVNYLYNEGYSEEDVKLASFRGLHLSTAIKAMRYDKSKEKANATAKKVVKIPKVLRPGSESTDTPHGADDKNDPVSILYGKG